MKSLLFTYGTLMKGQSRCSVLDTSKYLFDAVLDDYVLYDVGSFPGAVAYLGFRVYGEVYEIDDSLRPLLDQIEGEGYLYKYKEVSVKDFNNNKYNVGFYEYLGDTSSLVLRDSDSKWSIDNK